MLKALFVFGTRPEAIKLSPVIRHMQARPALFDVQVVVTAQHRQMLDQVLGIFDIHPHYDLNLMVPGQTLAGLSARMLQSLEPVFREVRPDIVYVQGDTTSTLCGALGAFYEKIPIGHIEAGLRTGDLSQPFPEEMNRVMTGRLAAIHFAPTEKARSNLLHEGVKSDAIYVTGNSGIDAVLQTRDYLASARSGGTLREKIEVKNWDFLDPSKKLIVVTAHRRESFGAGMEGICRAIRSLARRSDVEVVFPVHRNPCVTGPVMSLLDGVPGIHLIEPLDYVPFVDLMSRACILLTDSGGIQEEGPSLGKPVVVLREKTERPEAVEAGTAILAGNNEEKIIAEVSRLLDDHYAREAMSRIHNPYGDGMASAKIADATLGWFARRSNRPASTACGCT